MMSVLDIENTAGARIRKLLLSFGAVGGAYYVQIQAGQPITWPVMALVAVAVTVFVSEDTLDKALQSGALGKLKDKLIPNGGK